MKLRRFLLPLLFAAAALPAHPQHADVNDRMLDSVVYVECDVELQGVPIEAGSGSGFLIARSEYVVTNNHVIDSCIPDHGIAVLKGKVREGIVAQFKNGGRARDQLLEELKGDPELLARLSADEAQLRAYINKWIDRVATSYAMDKSGGIRQKLYVVAMGKSGQSVDSVRTDVSAIVWDATRSDRLRDTGVDLAVLKLVRPLADRAPVAGFATGSSARVNDEVYAVGFPGASGEFVTSGRYVPTMKRGIVSKLGGESPFTTERARAQGLKGAPVIEIDARINHGNSGGPLYNQFGEVLGVNTLGTEAGFGWALDIDSLIPILQNLGLPVPEVRREPPGWFDRNRALVWAAVAGTGVLMLVGMALLTRRARPSPSPSAAPPLPPGRSAAALVGRAGQFKGVSIPIPADGLVLGREPGGSGQLRFAEDSDLSRRHCTVDYDAATRRFRVTDLGSSNGTFSLPDGKRLAANQPWPCAPGQRVRLGRETVFELRAP